MAFFKLAMVLRTSAYRNLHEAPEDKASEVRQIMYNHKFLTDGHRLP